MYALMNLTNTGKNMEGGVLLEFSPKYSTAESYASCKRETSDLQLMTQIKQLAMLET